VPASLLPLAAATTADTGSVIAGDGSRTERPDSGADASVVLGSRLRGLVDSSSGGGSGGSGGQVLNRHELKRMSERLARGKRRASVSGGGGSTGGGGATASPLQRKA